MRGRHGDGWLRQSILQRSSLRTFVRVMHAAGPGDVCEPPLVYVAVNCSPPQLQSMLWVEYKLAMSSWHFVRVQSARKLEKKREEVRLFLDETKGLIDEALYQAELAGDTGAPERAAKALAALDQLTKQTVSAVSKVELEAINEQAKVHGRQRAYALPADALYDEALYKVGELEEWRLPHDIMQRLRDRVQLLKAADTRAEHLRRMLLVEVYEDVDYWDEAADWHERFLKWIVIVLVPFCVLALASSLASFLYLQGAIFGFVLAGLSGAALSILLKLPPLQVHGETVGAWQRMLARLAAGTVASTVGLGLFSSGLINIGIIDPNGGILSPATVVAECVSRAPVRSRSIADQDKCTAGNVMLLVSIGIVFGFSERSLASFQRVVMSRVPQSGRTGKREASRPLSSS